MNGIAAKPSKEVRSGDKIEIRQRHRLRKVSVTEIPASKQVAKSSAAGFYRVIEDREVKDDLDLI